MEPASRTLASRLAFVVAKRIAAILLPLGFGVGDFVAAAKLAFVEAAADQIKKRRERPSTARIAVVTGLSRAEVAKIRASKQNAPRPFAAQRTERVMHGWFTDPRYVGPDGRPRPLSMTGPGSFDELVRMHSGDIPRRAVLAELLAGGMAEVGDSGEVIALRRHYLLAPGGPPADLEVLATDADVFFRGAATGTQGDLAMIRRVSAQFPDGIPLSVRRTASLRTERFLEALADYLHTASKPSPSQRRANDSGGTVFHIMITQCETEDSD